MISIFSYSCLRSEKWIMKTITERTFFVDFLCRCCDKNNIILGSSLVHYPDFFFFFNLENRSLALWISGTPCSIQIFETQ